MTDLDLEPMTDIELDEFRSHYAVIADRIVMLPRNPHSTVVGSPTHCWGCGLPCRADYCWACLKFGANRHTPAPKPKTAATPVANRWDQLEPTPRPELFHGPCVACGKPTHRYRDGGQPPCTHCLHSEGPNR